MKKLSVICLLVAGIILFSGCIDEEKTNSKTSTSPQTSMNETFKETSTSPLISIPTPLDNYSSWAVPETSRPELIPGVFDININSYYLVYMRDNVVINGKKSTPTLDLFEKNYVIYHLSIKNNDTNTLNFYTNKLQLHTQNQVYSPAGPGTILKSFQELVSSEIENENRLNDTLLHPGQILEGIVIFQVDNYTTLFDRSFSLMYNTAPIPSTSYEKSLKALSVAEQFDYSIAFDMPPYDIDGIDGAYYSYDPPEPEVSHVWTIWGRDLVLYKTHRHFNVWANWVNRTVFEYYKEYDEMSLPKAKYIPYVHIGYAIKVIPEQDLNVFYTDHHTSTQMHVVDNTGEELFNRSIDSWNDNNGLAILDNQTYSLFPKTMPQMFIPQATTVHFSFYSYIGMSLGARLSINDQDIILDEQHNIILARYKNAKIVS